MRPARGSILLSVAILALSAPSAPAADEMESMFGAWGRITDDPKAGGCRLYARRNEGDYFVLGKDFVETGDGCVCILEGSRPSDACFDVNLFCRCEDGMTVRRRYQRLCPTDAPSRLEVTEGGEALSYERCKTRR